MSGIPTAEDSYRQTHDNARYGAIVHCREKIHGLITHAFGSPSPKPGSLAAYARERELWGNHQALEAIEAATGVRDVARDGSGPAYGVVDGKVIPDEANSYLP